jgi:hypothetical protein
MTSSALALCAVTLLVALGTGCISIYGRSFDVGRTGEIRPTMDKAAVRSVLGEPLSTQTLAGPRCTERWLWFHQRSSFTSTFAESTTVNFDSNGKVCVQ